MKYKWATESTLEDIRVWVEEGKLIAASLADAGDQEGAKAWNELIDCQLSSFDLAICTSCAVCFVRTSWDNEGQCSKCELEEFESWQGLQDAKREAYQANQDKNLGHYTYKFKRQEEE